MQSFQSRQEEALPEIKLFSWLIPGSSSPGFYILIPASLRVSQADPGALSLHSSFPEGLHPANSRLSATPNPGAPKVRVRERSCSGWEFRDMPLEEKL